MRGAFGVPYSTSLSWVSISGRFSSTTTMVSSPSAKRRAPSGSSGKGIATLYNRIPSRRAAASSIPRSSNACRTSRYDLPVVATPSHARSESHTVRSRRLARENAFTASIFCSYSRTSCSWGVSGQRIPSPSAGMAGSSGRTIPIRSGSISTEAAASTVSCTHLSAVQQPA